MPVLKTKTTVTLPGSCMIVLKCGGKEKCQRGCPCRRKPSILRYYQKCHHENLVLQPFFRFSYCKENPSNVTLR